MKHRVAIAIEESDNSVDKIAEHFGRCTKFVVHEIDDNKQVIKSEEYFNPLCGHHGGTCQLPAYIQKFDVNTIIAGGMGGKAVANFEAFEIDVITAPGMLVNEALQLFLDGKLTGYEACAGHDSEHNCG